MDMCYHYRTLLPFPICCILRGPGGERILNVVPRGTELGTQVKTGSRPGRTHSQ